MARTHVNESSFGNFTSGNCAVLEAISVPYIVLLVVSFSPLNVTVREEAAGAMISKVVVALRSPVMARLPPDTEAVRSRYPPLTIIGVPVLCEATRPWVDG